ncbi:MAG: hypothetical protein U0V49_12470 [Saprospiraceae bacterium]
MTFDSSEKVTADVIFRLTALWAMNESGIGGFLHLFHFPFSGIILTGLSVMLVTLICHYGNLDWKVLSRSLILVLIIKLSLSPHTSFTAYLAVSIQAIICFFVYRTIGINQISILLSCVLTFLESALQKIIVLTIFFGQRMYEVFDEFVNQYLGKNLEFIGMGASSIAFSFYIAVYLIAAVVSALYINYLYRRMISGDIGEITFFSQSTSQVTVTNNHPKFKYGIISLFVFFIAIVIMMFLTGKESFIEIYLLRTLLILAIWFLFVIPIIKYLMSRYFDKYRVVYKDQIASIINFFPSLISLVRLSMDALKSYVWYLRPIKFFEFLLYRLLFDPML